MLRHQLAQLRPLHPWAWLALLGLAGCVEAYMPEVVSASASYLVVDGFINGNGRTRIRLSRTENIAATTAPPAEKGAKLFIQSEAGTRYTLSEASSGYYVSDSLLLPAGRRYQLLITTAGAGSSAASYASDLVALKVTPPIEKLGWKLNDNDIDIQLSTHDASGQSRYYRWGFAETWEFHAAIQAQLEYYPQLAAAQKFALDNRTTPIYTCWRTERPTTIKQATSAQLGQDALADALLLSFSTKAERFKIRYSVLVSQYAETAEEFAYYEVLRKNTEAVGTVNDPLPSQLTGNVHRTGNAAEPVLGFVGAHTVQTKRLFIDHTELPFRNEWEYDTPYGDCRISNNYYCDSNGNCDVAALVNLFSLPGSVPVEFIDDPTNGKGVASATSFCADCRTRGSNVKPSFW